MEDLIGERTDGVTELVDRDDDVVRGDAAGVRVRGVILEPLHLRALENLHAAVDQHILESLQEPQGIDSVSAAVADRGRVSLRAEDLRQLLGVVRALIREADTLPALELRLDGACPAGAEPEK